jgi:hypothetical protein
MNETTLQFGTPISLIWYDNGEPRSLIATVQQAEPLIVEVNDLSIESVPTNHPMKILVQNTGVFETADSVVGSVTKVGGRWRVALGALTWQKSDRRSHKRHPAKLMVKCRFVSEDSSGASIKEFTVTSKDVSMGGAWIASDSDIATGSILNVELSTSPTSHVRALAVVAWNDPNGRGFGIEFLDLIGSSKTSLLGFIRELAA